MLRKTAYLLSLILLSGLLGGCFAPTPDRSQFYTIRKPAYPPFYLIYQEPFTKTVKVNDIYIADYLDQPQIATRTGPANIHFSEFHRWAEPLAETISYELTQRLRRSLQNQAVYNYPWPYGMEYDYTIQLNVSQFIADPQTSNVLFEGNWQLSTEENSQPQVYPFSIQTPYEGNYIDMVLTMSKSLDALVKSMKEQLMATQAAEATTQSS